MALHKEILRNCQKIIKNSLKNLVITYLLLDKEINQTTNYLFDWKAIVRPNSVAQP